MSYKTKNLFRVTLNCSNGTMTIANRAGISLQAGNMGQSIQTVAFESTLEAANTALASVLYGINVRLADTIHVHVYDLGSVTTPVLWANKSITVEYDCAEAAPPRVNSAVWNDNSALVLVTLDRITTMAGLSNPGVISCGTMFEAATVAAFGSNPVCTWTSTIYFFNISD